MASRVEIPSAFASNEVLDELRGVDPVLEDYLDRLTAPLIGLTDYETRAAFRLETQEHLEVRIGQIERDGMDHARAARTAIERFGPAHVASEQFLATWFEAGTASPLLKRIGRSNGIAFSRFVLAHLGYILLLQLLVFVPSGAAYALPLSPATMRRIVPEPLPMPDQPWAIALIYAYPILAPLVAGWSTGLAVPVRTWRAVYNAVLPLAVYSFAVGVLMLPMTAGLLYGLFQVVFWLPAGGLFAFLGCTAARSRNLQREGPDAV